MTCQDSPLDIKLADATPCSLKCNLYYKYGNSTCHITNAINNLRILYDGKSDVVFNNLAYTPTEIRIFAPSIHTFGDERALAEIIVYHTSSRGGLLVCIPITEGRAPPGKDTEIISALISQAPGVNESTSLNIADFNVNFLIPKSRYFTYAGPLPYGPCDPSKIFQYVVFHPRFGSVVLDATTIKKLSQSIHSSNIATKRGEAVYVNIKGTTANGFAGNGQIYIDCQPTGQSEEEVVYKETELPSTGVSSKTWVSIIFILIGAVVIMLTFYFMKFILSRFTPKPKLPPVPKII